MSYDSATQANMLFFVVFSMTILKFSGHPFLSFLCRKFKMCVISSLLSGRVNAGNPDK